MNHKPSDTIFKKTSKNQTRKMLKVVQASKPHEASLPDLVYNPGGHQLAETTEKSRKDQQKWEILTTALLHFFRS